MASAQYLDCTARQTRGKFYATEKYFVKSCTGAIPIQVLADALAATGIPATAATLVVTIGAITKTLGVSVRTPEVVEPDSAVVSVEYTEDDVVIPGFAPTIREYAADLEQIETIYDYANRLAWFSNPASATTIKVTYGSIVKSARVPALVPRGTRVYTQEGTTNPEEFADNYIGRTNSATFGLSAAVGTLLCVSIRGVNVGDGRWKTTYAFAKRDEGWKAIALYPFADGTIPEGISEGDGLKTVTVQGSADFNDLGLL